MDVTALLLSRLQFAFTISYHIIFPALTIGLAAWLTVLEGFHLATGRVAYRVLFDFWLKIFAVAFALLTLLYQFLDSHLDWFYLLNPTDLHDLSVRAIGRH